MENDIEYIPLDNFRTIKHIKTDGYGIIYTAYWVKKSRNVALKYIPTYWENEVDILEMSKEIYDLKKNTHKNITQVLGMSKDNEKQAIAVVLQNTDCSLREYLKKNRSLEWSERLKLAYEIASGLNYLHLLDYVHRNLHSLNVFITHKKAVIMDPRLSLIHNETQSLNTLERMIPYVAPEELENPNNVPDFKCDIYGLGVLFWEISSGREPFQNENHATIAQKIINNMRESPVEGTSEDYIKLYTRCWDRDPDVRPESSDICQKLQFIFKELYPQDWNLLIMNNELSEYDENSSRERKRRSSYIYRSIKRKMGNMKMFKKLLTKRSTNNINCA